MAGPSWWDGLQDRLRRRGVWDPFTPRHVRDDFVIFYEDWKRAVDAGEDPVLSFRRIFLGLEDELGVPAPDPLVADRPGRKAPRSRRKNTSRSPEPGPEGLQLVRAQLLARPTCG